MSKRKITDYVKNKMSAEERKEAVEAILQDDFDDSVESDFTPKQWEKMIIEMFMNEEWLYNHPWGGT